MSQSWPSFILSAFYDTTSRFFAGGLGTGLATFRTTLNGGQNPTLRIYVAGTTGLGHQASSVLVLRRLAAPTNGPVPGFAFAGTIEVYYVGGDATKAKLYNLIPEIDPATNTGPVNNATVTLIPLTNPPPATAVNFAFTGGADDDINYAEKLNAAYFLRLQPYRWEQAEQIQFNSSVWPYVNLLQQNVLGGASFTQRAYYMSNPPVPNWDQYINGGDADIQRNAEVLQWLTANAQLNQFDLGPVYSIRNRQKCEMGSPASDRIFQVVAGILASQTSETKPAILVNLDDYDPDHYPDQSSFPYISSVLSGAPTAYERPFVSKAKGGLADKGNPETERAFDSRSAYVQQVQAGQRTTFLNQPTLQQVQRAASSLQGMQVLFLQLGRVPQPIFNYTFSRASLPTIFEGQNTSSLALNLGNYYLQVGRPSSEKVQYPDIVLPPQVTGQIPLRLQGIANQVRSSPGEWPDIPANNPAEIIGRFIREFRSGQGEGAEFQAYFNQVRNFYQNPDNDKLNQGINYLNYVVNGRPRPAAAGADLAVRADAQDDNVLDQLYQELEDARKPDDTLQLVPQVFGTGTVIGDYFIDFLQSFSGGILTMLVESLEKKEEDGVTVAIDLQGATDVFGVETGLAVVYTAPEEKIVATTKFTGRDDWSVPGEPGVPWIVFSHPFVEMEVTDAALPSVGAVGGTLNVSDFELTFQLRVPVQENRWLFEAAFAKPLPSIAAFYQLAGGINIAASLPAPLNVLSALGLSNLELLYAHDVEATAGAPEYMGFVLATDETLELLPNITLQEIKIEFTVLAPGNVATRSWTTSMKGDFNLGKSLIQVSVAVPSMVFVGQLVEGEITIEDFLQVFLPGIPLNLPQVPTITDFYFYYNEGDDDLSVAINLNIDWTITVLGSDLFTLEQLAMNVARARGLNTGSLTASTVILPGTQDIGLEMAAYYLGATAGWTFEGRQTSGTVPTLLDLLVYYLGDGWDNGTASYGIDGLNLRIETNTNYWSFGGKTAEPWVIPFIPGDLSIDARLTMGYGDFSSGVAAVLGPGDAARGAELVSAEGQHLATLADDSKVGQYGSLEATVEWFGIDLLVFYNYNPNYQSFGITLGIVTGKVTQENPPEGDWIGELTLTGETIGSIVETMVSWATGQSFALAAPWSVLNSVSLNAFSLKFNFTTNKVSFEIGIGPINLGFANIEAIAISYNTEGSDEEKGVMVELIGSFLWTSDGSLPPWDATKPEETPTPPGNGNDYFDLRLLAMGQHVTIDCIPMSDTVQKAIQCLGELPLPEPGEIPVGGPGQPVFDPNSNWLIGTDFGVLKLTGEGESGYFLTLQVVFNDPYLYALRIALEGAPAKIFDGLDFQILYRQVSETVGVYQAELTLPKLMRRFSVGAVTVTLPTFAIAVFTNGDFQVDFGFPWNEDFSRSFTLEAIIPPGIPVLGSGGFYFGKLSSETTDRVPTTSLGTFNPVIVFGFGAQLGLGKSVEAGILSAGFSLTLLGILEGVIAKWNPYQLTDGGNSGEDQLQGEYYFYMSGTTGIAGRLYGTVDFAIIKADVNVAITLTVQLVYESYADIDLTVAATVDVSLTVKINLGLFKVKVKLSFYMRLTESFTLLNIGGQAPWTDNSNTLMAANRGLLRQPRSARSVARRQRPAVEVTPDWSNLTAPATPAPLSGYLTPGLTMARDERLPDTDQDPKKQLACYVAMLFIDSVPAVAEGTELSARKAAGEVADTSFELLSKQVLRWAIASIQPGPLSAAEVDELVISEESLEALLQYLSDPSNPNPIPPQAIDQFLDEQFLFTAQAPEGEVDADVTYFPMALGLELDIPAYGDDYGPYNYTFGGYNSLSAGYLQLLRIYFAALQVTVEEEDRRQERLGAMPRLATDGVNVSVASFVFSDYFVLLARQMVQAALDGLRDFKYPIEKGQSVDDLVTWVNDVGDLGGAFTTYDLFAANPAHQLESGKKLEIAGSTYQAISGDTFDTIAAQEVWNGGFTADQLATTNQDNNNILLPGAVITYDAGGASMNYEVVNDDTLQKIADDLFDGSVSELLANSNVLEAEGLLTTVALLTVPDFPYTTVDSDTLESVAARYGVAIENLADAPQNSTIVDLFSIVEDPNLDLAELPQFQVGELIAEAQRSLAIEQLSGMTSRFYLQSLRLPTEFESTQMAANLDLSQEDLAQEGITPLAEGMWVQDESGTLTLPAAAGLFALSGQQFPLPVIGKDPFTFTFNRPGSLTWLQFGGADPDQLTVTIQPDSEAAASIDKVFAYAVSTRLDTEARRLGPDPMSNTSPSRYPLSNVVEWQNANPVALPYGTPPDAVAPLGLWQLPDSLINLPDPATRAVDPRFALRVARYDEATGGIVESAVTYYGWGTLLNFTIKRVPALRDSPSTATTYEIVGSGGVDILLMERLLAQGGADNSIYQTLILGYAPEQTGDAPAGVQTAADVTMGISQVNLSTETQPPSQAFQRSAAADEETRVTLLNEPSEFIRLLWQASITRSGGYFLYYYDLATDVGLPDRLFNDKDEATVSLVLLYQAPSAVAAQNRVADYMNIVATGQNIDTSNSVLVALADPTPAQVTASTETTLAEVAYRYYTNVADLGLDNATLTLTEGVAVTVSGGVYEVPPAGVEPGGELANISAWFDISGEAIEAANPRISDWSQALPLYTAIRLPDTVLTLGTSPGGNTLADIASYYGADITSLAADNQQTAGLFTVDQVIDVAGGPTMRSATVPAGTVALGATRPVPPETPDDPGASDYARLFLLNDFNLLGYRVWANQDFRESDMGLPAGPADNPDLNGEPAGKMRQPQVLEEGDAWNYAQSVPYSRFAIEEMIPAAEEGLPNPALSPYLGVGFLLQLDFDWQDLYGNLLVTTLSDPTASDYQPLNKPPILAGYTDSLLGLGQWSSVSSGYMVAPVEDSPQLILGLSFAASNYEPSGDPDDRGWQEKAARDLEVYRRLYFQLTDPNGIAYGIKTSLLQGAGELQLSTSQVQELLDWLFYGSENETSIFQFLTDRAAGSTKVPPPPEEIHFTHPFDSRAVNPAQIFELRLAFVIERTGGQVEGEFKTTPGIRRTATVVAVSNLDLPGSQDPNDDGTLALDAFAAAFEEALREPGVSELKVATGENRNQVSTGQNGSVWAVRLGLDGSAISYTVRNPGAPIIFAPRPISNRLESRNQVPLYDYSTGRGIDFETPSRFVDFADVDMDTWGRQFLGAVDYVLTPQFTSPTLIVGERMDHDYLGEILGSKKALASILKLMMIPAFLGESADSDELAAIQEAFEQQLLVRLSNAYSTRAGIEFQADVVAEAEPDAAEPPRLYGTVEQTEEETEADVNLTSPKLMLESNPQDEPHQLAFLLSSADKRGTGPVRSFLTLDLAYQSANIEHQVAAPDMEGFQASSWLSFVLNEGQGPLDAELGTFDVPLALRSFPATPTLPIQNGGQTVAQPDSLGEIVQWTYTFTYAQAFHFPQDRVYCEVEFNLAEAAQARSAGLRDAFEPLAEFINVFPQVREDLVGILATVDATTTDQQTLDDAAVALVSFIELVDRVVVAAEGGQGLAVARAPRALVGTTSEPYPFFIQECSVEMDGTDALLVTLIGRPPAGIGTPVVEVAPDEYDAEPYTENDCSEQPCDGVDRFCWVYKKKGTDDEYLSAAEGQSIADRQVVLPAMDVLARQDAKTTVFLKRNEELVPGKPSAEPFVYTTPEVTYPSLYHPTIDSDEVIDIATLGSPGGTPITRSLDQQLTALFDALLQDNTQDLLNIQMGTSYEYSVNQHLGPIPLPVVLQPPLLVDVGNSGSATPLSQMISDLSTSIETSFQVHAPSGSNGVLWFDLTMMSNLTIEPMPLLRLRRLKLEIQYIQPALVTG